jgi:heme/copper-type cytochrome/quinol oxidase subunit 1
MAEPVHSRRTRIILAYAYIAIGIGLLAFVLCCALGILLGSMGMDIHLTEGYFVIAHFHWLRLFGVVVGIAAIITLARTLYARFIGS